MRFVLNFNNKCNLSCEWCYVNFNGEYPQKEKIINIIDIFVKNNFTIITIGGGDPFQYNWIKEVIMFAKKSGLFVHVDTNAFMLKENDDNKEFIVNYIDLIGIPFDAWTENLKDEIRNKKNYYNLIRKKIEWLNSFSTNLKINTFMSKKNIYELNQIADFILEINPNIWSIYQFCSVNHIDNIKLKYELNDNLFKSYTNLLLNKFKESKVKLEIVSSKNREKKYPIVTSDGKIEIFNYHDKKHYYLGNIFSKDIMKRIEENCQNNKSFRYIDLISSK